MPLTHLHITDFRNLAAITFEPLAPGFNLLYGLNGSGKTSVLEAIYYLSFGRSFRGSTVDRIIRNTADKFLIFAQNMLHNGQIIPIGIERQQRGDLKIRIAGEDAQSIVEVANLIPVQLINSHSYNLLEGGPLWRRKYLDWGVFYLKKDFFQVWRSYNQLLKQRNAALRSQRPKKELIIWTEGLALKALELDQLRREYLGFLLPLLINTVAELIPLPDLDISYHAGWDEALNYQDVLQAALDKDLQFGYTQFGPHRADFKIKINQANAKDILSRGQQKLFVCAMILAQGILLRSCTNKKPIYLIDDLPAELDVISRANLIALLSQQETQVFVTAVEAAALSEMLSPLPVKMFHVEHGCVAERNPAKNSNVPRGTLAGNREQHSQILE